MWGGEVAERKCGKGSTGKIPCLCVPLLHPNISEWLWSWAVSTGCVPEQGEDGPEGMRESILTGPCCLGKRYPIVVQPCSAGSVAALAGCGIAHSAAIKRQRSLLEENKHTFQCFAHEPLVPLQSWKLTQNLKSMFWTYFQYFRNVKGRMSIFNND